ncbi:ATP-dependent Clp endopeptidase proteolytic subunit ClpP [Sedimentibacter acidaminivorans]|uniref:ATP-dependent Clp protease proteolytic subunit n=1 Tax=Sedimentibacter acidaminivorans TaxID=913099 RepID=A0ABS4GDT2_9FIRM|nr:head maturation protease, ClpP-related [Sedimentibacter acidaminivorans]MBP1925846.1 ATP-dependent Clp endopeptidase proteolytic subunit ClpP [Sedimentibacter acidaminivorans]
MTKKIEIKGVIVSDDEAWIYEWIGISATNPKKVNDLIEKANGEDLEFYINSPGGDVFAGSELYTVLKEYKGKTTGKIIGLAASAASVIAMGCKVLFMSPTAEMMIHNVSSGAQGDYRAMEHSANMLKDYNSTLANAYAIKSGMDKKDILEMMDAETWLTPEKALKYKLIDGILFDDRLEIDNTKERFELLKNNKTDTKAAALANAKLNLLKLEGERNYE